jgi:hypothetical protein
MVWRDRQEFRLELIALADVDRDDLVGQAEFFQCIMNFVAVGGRPGPDLDLFAPFVAGWRQPSRFISETSKAGSAQLRRPAINCLMAPIALAGLSRFGQVSVQFMIVWQRYSLNGSSSSSSRAPVASSRESAIQR